MSNSESASFGFSPAGVPEDDPSVLLGFESEAAQSQTAPSDPAAHVEPVAGVVEPAVPVEKPVAPAAAAARVDPMAGPVALALDLAPEPVQAVQPVQVPAKSAPERETVPDSAVSLSQIRSSGIPIRWYEAVAITEGLCEALIDSHQDTMVVTLDTVFVCAEGRIYAAGSEHRTAAAAVNALGRIFEEVAELDLPAPLKFAAAKATASPPVYASVQEFFRTLAYFERPNRVELLQGIYQGWKRQPPPVAPAIRIAPVANDERALETVYEILPPPRRSGWPVLTAIAALGLCGISLLAFGLRPRSNVAGVPGPVAAADADRAVERALSSGHAEPRSVVPVAGGMHVSRGRWIKLPERAPGITPGARSSENAAAALSAGGAAVTKQFSGATMADSGTYSVADSDVVPPVAVYPKLPSLRSSDPGVAAFEIVVTELGTVEAVKANDAPPSIGQAMQMTNILSAAKAWRFRPASKDGLSVRYRLVVWLQIH